MFQCFHSLAFAFAARRFARRLAQFTVLAEVRVGVRGLPCTRPPRWRALRQVLARRRGPAEPVSPDHSYTWLPTSSPTVSLKVLTQAMLEIEMAPCFLPPFYSRNLEL